jgi:hypothetical protein
LSQNPNAIHLIARLDNNKMRDNNKEFFKELVEYVFNPVRIQIISENYGFDMEEYLEHI